VAASASEIRNLRAEPRRGWTGSSGESGEGSDGDERDDQVGEECAKNDGDGAGSGMTGDGRRV
jgi:hypothetical protein